MLVNRSIPRGTVIPELAYPDVGEAKDWRCDAFGFTLRLAIGTHRIQLHVGEDGGAVVLTERHGDAAGDRTHAVLVRVEDVDAHHARAQRHGARMLRAPADYPYGERQYTAEDPGGHCWTFSQSIADVDPTTWGGTPGRL